MRYGIRAAALLGAWIALGAGCAHTRHTVEPYRSDPDAAALLEVRAAADCAERLGADWPEARTFVTDGCSAWRDGPWVHCCVEHDIAYWCGGPSRDRSDADRELAACVGEAYGSGMGGFMRLGVRAGGLPYYPTPWRWGFGRRWPSGYDEPRPEED